MTLFHWRGVFQHKNCWAFTACAHDWVLNKGLTVLASLRSYFLELRNLLVQRSEFWIHASAQVIYSRAFNWLVRDFWSYRFSNFLKLFLIFFVLRKIIERCEVNSTKRVSFVWLRNKRVSVRSFWPLWHLLGLGVGFLEWDFTSPKIMLLLNWSIPILSFLNHGAHAFLWFFIIRNTLNLLKYWIDLLDFRQWLFNFDLSHWLENFWSSYHNTILCNFYSFFNNDFFFLHLALQNIVVSSISDLILFILFFSDRCHDSSWPNIIWRLILVPWIWSLCKIWVIFEVDTRRSCSYRAFWCNWFVWSLRSLPFLLQWNPFNYLWRV